jgi:hypothetical protein
MSTVDDTRRWLALASQHVLVGGSAVAFESDRWFLAALNGLSEGAAHAQRGVDTLVHAVVMQWLQRRPSWMRRRTPRERIERALRTEARRQGLDVKSEEFAAFSRKMALLLELVYARAVPLDAIAIEGAEAPEADVEATG